MAASQANGQEDTSVSSRITLFNHAAEQHQNWMMINPFAHYNVNDIPKRSFGQEEYGKPPTGSLSEQRSLQANVLALEQILQLLEVIANNGELDPINQSLRRVEFGPLFNLYNDISDKLMGTMLAARKAGFVDFSGETLFQGRDENVEIRLLRPFEELKAEILAKVEDLRCVYTEKPLETTVLRED